MNVLGVIVSWWYIMCCNNFQMMSFSGYLLTTTVVFLRFWSFHFIFLSCDCVPLFFSMLCLFFFNKNMHKNYVKIMNIHEPNQMKNDTINNKYNKWINRKWTKMVPVDLLATSRKVNLKWMREKGRAWVYQIWKVTYVHRKYNVVALVIEESKPNFWLSCTTKQK